MYIDMPTAVIPLYPIYIACDCEHGFVGMCEDVHVDMCADMCEISSFDISSAKIGLVTAKMSATLSFYQRP